MNKKMYLLLLLVHCCAIGSEEDVRESLREKQEKNEKEWSKEKKILVAAGIICAVAGAAWLLRPCPTDIYSDKKKEALSEFARRASNDKQRDNHKSLQKQLCDAIMFKEVDEVAALIQNPQVDLTLPIYGSGDNKGLLASNALFLAIDEAHSRAYNLDRAITVFHAILLKFDPKKISEPINGETYLTTAIYQGGSQVPLEVIKALLNAGADPNGMSKAYCGSRPLHRAVYRFGAMKKDDGCVQLLLAHKADPETKNDFEQTPLDFAKTYFSQKPEMYTRLNPDMYKTFAALLSG